MLLPNLPYPGGAVCHLGTIAPHADECFVFEVEGLVGCRFRLGITLLQEGNEIYHELLGCGRQGRDVVSQLLKFGHRTQSAKQLLFTVSLGQQSETLAVVGPKDTEVSLVDCQDGCDT